MHKKTQVNQAIKSEQSKKFTGAVGTILSYDRYTNTATVLASKTETDEVGEVLTNVPCPTYMGVQMAAPEPGRLCYMIFKNGNVTHPIITHFYNHRYDQYDYGRQIGSPNDLPTYLLG